ncbi:hypothetical protein M3Y98_00578100 [Aphelenchoides besseyi]|nr:hypothetical protein M3Y98_00578100 [Aphelenchoides besseyi]
MHNLVPKVTKMMPFFPNLRQLYCRFETYDYPHEELSLQKLVVWIRDECRKIEELQKASLSLTDVVLVYNFKIRKAESKKVVKQLVKEILNTTEFKVLRFAKLWNYGESNQMVLPLYNLKSTWIHLHLMMMMNRKMIIYGKPGPMEIQPEEPTVGSTQQSASSSSQSSLPLFLQGAPEDAVEEYKRIIRTPKSTYEEQVKQIDQLVARLDESKQYLVCLRGWTTSSICVSLMFELIQFCQLNGFQSPCFNTEKENRCKMTLQVEVDDGNHNCRCYELQNRDISALSDIVGTHSRAQNVELIVQCINDNRPKTNGKSRDYKLDATTLFRSSNLSKLNLQLGGQIVLEISAPFYLPIQELALVEVAISLYDFAILIRAVSLSLQHLCLEKLRILDSTSSNDFLLELQRVRALYSLRIDLPLSELLVTVVVFSVIFVAIDALNDEGASIAVEQEPMEIMEKRVPHPSWRSNVRVSQFQQGAMPPLARYLPLPTGRQIYFGRYARVPFSFNIPSF